MNTLLLQLEGPMQSWGTQSRFVDRDAGSEPSKSGVIGLICAAQGRPRSADVSDLAALAMGVAVFREGVAQRDYQTAGARYPAFDARGRPTGKFRGAAISPRYYLSDASFLVGLEGERRTLATLGAALAAPVWQLYLGRKAFVPSLPICLPDGSGIHEGRLKEALLSSAAIQVKEAGESGGARRIRLVLEDALQGTELRQDVPLSFAERRFATRKVVTTWEEIE